MVEPTGHRKLVGNVCLYRHLALRPQPFLRRNLNFVLDQHERRLAALMDPDGRVEGKEMVANGKRKSGWDYPTKEMLQDLLRGQKPMLKIDGLQIRPPGAVTEKGQVEFHNARKRSHSQSENDDWLPSPDIDFSAACVITVIFRDASYGGSHGRMYVDTRPAVIQSRETHEDKSRQFDVCLDEPFMVEVGKIYVTVEMGKNGAQRWKRSIPAQYELEVEINFLDPDDSARMLSMLDDNPKLENLSNKQSTLRTTWSNLPDCPPPGELLTLTRSNVYRNIEFAHGIEVSMGWSRKRDSPLTQYTRIVRNAGEEKQSQLPTPSSSAGSEKAAERGHLITYVFQKTRYHTEDNLRCPLCEVELMQARANFPSFDRLHLHFLTHHDHFRVRVEEDAAKDPSSPITKTVHLELAEKSFEKTSLSPDEEETWIAPDTPFDQAAYLRGEDKWTGHPKVKPQGRPAPKRGRPPYRASASETVVPSEQQKAAARPPVQEVKDLRPKQKKRHAVPTVPGVRFYRTLSKRPFKEAEMVAESDDEVDETWLAARFQHDLASLDLTPAASEFIEDFNAYAGEEDFGADVFTRQSIVRFIRKFEAKAVHFEWLKEFYNFLEKLCQQRIIDPVIVQACRDVSRLYLQTTDELPGDPMDISSEDSPNGNNSCWHKRTCVCGELVHSTRLTTICEEPQCGVLFHMSCVGLERRQEGWICEACR